MAYMIVRHKIADYARWRSVFDEHAAVRGPAGSKGGWLLSGADDTNEIIVLLEWEDLEKAREFARSDELRQTMQRAGVIDRPDIYFLDQMERFDV